MGLGIGRLTSARSWTDLRPRLVSAVVLGLVVLGLVFSGGVGFRLLCCAASAIVFDEWTSVTGAKRAGRALTFARRALFASLLAFFFDWHVTSLLIVAGAGALIIVADRREHRANWAAGGLVYAAAAGLAPGFLRGDGPEGLAILGLIICVVWATDIFAYFAGRTFGGPKLLPAVSPKKTISGAVGGLLAGILFGAGYAALLTGTLSVQIGAISAILSIVGQAGDLFESWVKRRFGVKDSGRLIPGHGGLMDRIDALIVAAALTWLIGVLAIGFEHPARAFFMF